MIAIAQRMARVGAVGALASALVLSACGSESSDEAGDGGGLPDTVTLKASVSLSGLAGPGGQPTQKGMEVAIEEINDSKFLGSTTLKLDITDSKTDPKVGASAMAQHAASDTPVAIGSSAGAVALAEATVAQRQGLPLIFPQAGSKGVLETGDHIYRTTPLQTSYFHKTLEYLQTEGVKRAAVIYDSDNPTIQALNDLFQSGASKYGYEVVSTQATTSNTVDVSSQVTKMLNAKPDAIFVDVLQAHNVQVIKQLRQAGYDGLIVAQQGAAGGTLKPIAEDAEGVVFTNDFNPGSDNEGTKHFTELYQKKFDELPGNFAAEGYDTIWFAARAIKDADSVDRDKVLASMATVGEAGFVGALGELKIVDRQAVITTPVLVRLDNTAAEIPVE